LLFLLFILRKKGEKKKRKGGLQHYLLVKRGGGGGRATVLWGKAILENQVGNNQKKREKGKERKGRRFGDSPPVQFRHELDPEK